MSLPLKFLRLQPRLKFLRLKPSKRSKGNYPSRKSHARISQNSAFPGRQRNFGLWKHHLRIWGSTRGLVQLSPRSSPLSFLLPPALHQSHSAPLSTARGFQLRKVERKSKKLALRVCRSGKSSVHFQSWGWNKDSSTCKPKVSISVLFSRAAPLPG